MARFPESLVIALAISISISSFATAEVPKEKFFGAPCRYFTECGPQNGELTNLACVKGTCRCFGESYFDAVQNSCRSYVGGVCDPQKRNDGLAQNICGKSMTCTQIPDFLYGTCDCKKGYRETISKTCAPDFDYNGPFPVSSKSWNLTSSAFIISTPASESGSNCKSGFQAAFVWITMNTLMLFV